MFKNRIDAGIMLADKLSFLKDHPVVLAIPRGGIIVANEIVKKLGCSLDVIISKKITPPDNPEYAIGAITNDGVIYKGPNWDFYSADPAFREEISKKKSEVRRRIQEYRGSFEYNLENKTVVLVDDGIATGSTVLVILLWLKKQNVKQIFLAVPVLPKSAYHNLEQFVTKIFALEVPEDFNAVGQFYREFLQVKDQEVIDILKNKKD